MRLTQKQIVLLISSAIVITTLVAYEPIRHNGFVSYDDASYITENPNVTGGISLQSIKWALTKSYAVNWHPLTWLSHMADCQLFGLNPTGHHLVSVAIHIANALLVFGIFRSLGGAIWLSAFIAGVFALHPIQVESVAWAAERKTVLSGLFWLLTMAAYIRYAKVPRLNRYLLVLAIFGLCILTKPVVVTLPFALLLLDYWPLERFQWGHQVEAKNGKTNHRSPVWLIAEKTPLLAMSAILSGVTFIAQRGGEIVPTLERLPLEYRVANMFLSYIKYIVKMIWPSGLAICYPHPRAILSDAPVVICIILFILLTAASIYAGQRRKYAAVGWLWYVGTLVPVIGLVQAGAQGMANRYMYIPMLGLLIIIGWAVRDFTASRPRAKTAAAVMGVLVLLSLLILTRMQVKYWENSLTLFGHDIEVTKDNVLAENGYGCALSELGLLDEAEKHLQNAVRISPAYSEARNNLASVYLKKGMLNEAIACFNEIIRRNEATADIYYNLAAALEMQKKYDEAIKYYAKSLEMNPEDPAANKRMGIALLAAGKTNEAIGYAKRACELTGDRDAECLDALANGLAAAGKFDDAVRIAEKALNIAKSSGREDLAGKIRQRIKLYEAGQPYREQ
ncbi:MAG: tetratricopeptide repeat protein [Sedimentisphaerales bacterium]